MQDRELDILLLRYFDGSATDEEVATVNRLIATDPAVARAVLSASKYALMFRSAITGAANQALTDFPRLTKIEPAEEPATRPAFGWFIGSRPRMIAAAAAVLIAATAGWFILANRAPNEVAVQPVDGIVTLSEAGPDSWIDGQGKHRPAARGIPLASKDQLVTGPTAGASFNYPSEKTSVVLAPSSTLTVSAEPGGKQLQLSQGSVDCQVEKQQAGKAMVVITPQAKVRVVGTQFRVSTTNGWTRVEVSSGVVRVTRQSDGATVDVSANEFVDAGTDAKSQPATRKSPFAATAAKNMAEYWSTYVRPAGIDQ